MPARVNITIEATPEPAIIAAAYFAMAEKLQNLQEPLEYATGLANDEIAQNFQEQGRPTKWQPLADSTMLSRVMGTLSDVQKENLASMKEDSKFEGDLVTGDDGVATFVPAATSTYSRVFAGLASSVQILVRTGALQQAVTQGQNWKFRSLSGNESAFELTDPTGYGGYHLTGTQKNLPIRDWAYIPDETVDEMAEFMADWIIS